MTKEITAWNYSNEQIQTELPTWEEVYKVLIDIVQDK